MLPVRGKEREEGCTSRRGIYWGTSSMQGWRISMEDAHLAVASLGKVARIEGIPVLREDGWDDVAAFGVFDGHGGPQVARFCQKHLAKAIVRLPASDVPTALEEAFLYMDVMLRRASGAWELAQLSDPSAQNDSFWDPLSRFFVSPDTIGCTAVVCCVLENAFVVANVGDSRAVLCRGGTAVDLSKDHKPQDPSEYDRIRQAGGWVEADGDMYRVNGDLNLSRALGDLEYKRDIERSVGAQIISGQPDVVRVHKQPEDEFLIIACDGVWDVLSSQSAVDFVRERFGDRDSLPDRLNNDKVQLSSIASDLLDTCLSPDLEETEGLGGDNMTAIIVKLPCQVQEVTSSPSRPAISNTTRTCAPAVIQTRVLTKPVQPKPQVASIIMTSATLTPASSMSLPPAAAVVGAQPAGVAPRPNLNGIQPRASSFALAHAAAVPVTAGVAQVSTNKLLHQNHRVPAPMPLPARSVVRVRGAGAQRATV